jgi:hypothetical protein
MGEETVMFPSRRVLLGTLLALGVLSVDPASYSTWCPYPCSPIVYPSSPSAVALDPRAIEPEAVKQTIDVAASGKARVLFIGATQDSDIGLAVKEMQRNLRALIQTHLPPDRHDITFRNIDLQDTPDKILGWVDHWRVDPADAICCFVNTHGANDGSKGDTAHGHDFVFNGTKLAQQKLYDKLSSKGARLTILIGNSCNMPGLFHLKKRLRLPKDNSSCLVRLTLGYSGRINVQAVKKGENSTGFPFADAFQATVENHSQTEQGADEITWKAFWEEWQRRTTEDATATPMHPIEYELKVRRLP